MADLDSLVSTYRQRSGGVVNQELFDLMLHTHHSTAIEGGTLTLPETQTLLEKGLTAGGKPLHHHLMILDHQKALMFTLACAREKRPLNLDLIQQIAALVMHSTGSRINTILGSYDTAAGELRKGSVSAGGRLFMDAAKVSDALTRFCQEVNDTIPMLKSVREVYDFSFLTHFQFVSIHPLGDGNGRTARLLMNYVQDYHGLPLSLVFTDDRTTYYQALEDSRNNQTPQPILAFMHQQLERFLTEEIKRLTPDENPTVRKQGGLSLIF